MSVQLIGQAMGRFAATNVDDVVLLAVLFGRAPGRAGALKVAIGWYAGYPVVLSALLAAGILGARLLPGERRPLPRPGRGAVRCRMPGQQPTP